MKTKEEILKLYLNDLNNIVPQSPARDARIAMLESELIEEEAQCPYKGETYNLCPNWIAFTNGCADCVKYHKNQ